MNGRSRQARRPLMIAAAAALICGGCQTRPVSLAIEHVSVISMVGEQPVLPDRTILIRGDRIDSIVEPAAARIPPRARRIDGRGRFLLPAFTDMHVHVEDSHRLPPRRSGVPHPSLQDLFIPYVATGVLQVVNLSASPESLRQRERIEAGEVLGPRMILASRIDSVQDPVEAVRWVRLQHRMGFDAIKTYDLPISVFEAVVSEARRLHLPVIGHLPREPKNQTQRFLIPGFAMVAHAEEFAYQTDQIIDDRIPHYVQLMKRNGSWLTTTASTNVRIWEQTASLRTITRRPESDYVNAYLYCDWITDNHYAAQASPPRLSRLSAVIEFNRRLIRAFHEAGIPLVAGSDALNAGVVPGFSLHDELEQLARAGMSNHAVLASATRLPAQWLGVADDRGTVTPGKLADLVILDDNPLSDIRNSRSISAVIVGGRLVSRAELDAMLSGLAARNRDARRRLCPTAADAIAAPNPEAKPESDNEPF